MTNYMTRKIILLISFLFSLSSFSQNIVGLSSTKFGRYNFSNNTFSIMTNGCDTTWTTLGYSTFDQPNGRYIYTKSGLGNPDTLILVNSLSGNLISKQTFSAGHLQCPQYCQANNKVYGQSPVGFGVYDLTNNTYSVINPALCYYQYIGVSTFDQLNNRYIYKNHGNGWPDTLVLVSVPSGSLITKITYPSGGLSNPQYCQSNNKVYGLTSLGYGVLSISNSSYSIVNNQLYDNNVTEGFSTFDQVNNKYIFIRSAFGSNPDTLVTVSAINGTVLAKNTFPKGTLCNPEFFGLTIASTKEYSKFDAQILLYPNPTNGKTLISNISDADIIRVYDCSGKLVQSIIHDPSVDISIVDLSPGVYNVNVLGKNGSTNLKLVVH